MSRFRHHIFVCDNRRPEGGRPACGNHELLSALGEAVAARPDLWSQVKVSGSTCLGPCFDGPNMVVYPEGVWYAGVQPSDVSEIVQSHLTAGIPVERLRYRFPDESE